MSLIVIISWLENVHEGSSLAVSSWREGVRSDPFLGTPGLGTID